ncbi:hypothetical protein IHE45_01G047900 [Dioscorea alata]|uniref:Uncharacterized protein n=1 Tax=Dioscorea alata TaxID=55571 RepID=A0ACB7WTQ7_DIOAL|nr:hypothetical protein IHE45_01G047900 [Dioscorea alata]
MYWNYNIMMRLMCQKQIQPKMPCGYGRIIKNVDNGANGRRHSLSKRLLDHSNHKYSLKESEVSALVLRNSDGRCIYFTLVTFGLDGPLNFLAPFFLPVQGSDKTYNLESGAQPDAGSLESSSPPLAVSFHVDLQKEQNMSECKGSVQSLLGQNLRPKTSGEFRKRNKRTKSVRNSSSNTSGNCSSPENSSGAFCDGASAVCSDILLPDVSKASKLVKKNSRKKGKKKGKHSKQYIHRKASTHVETQCMEDVPAASVSEASGCSSHSSETNLSENSFSSGMSIEDINMEKDDGEENNIDLRNSIATAVEGRTCGTEMKDCEAPLLVRSDNEDFSCTQSCTDEDSILRRRSSVTESPETPLSLCDENTSKERLKGKSSYGVASSTSMDPHIAPVTDVSLDGWKSDISENCIDDIEVQSPVKHENTVNFSTRNLVSDCRINGTLFQNLNVDLCEMSSDGSNDILDVRSGSERAQCSSEACHSNDFILVDKKRRLARKMDKKLNGVSEFGSSKIHGRSGKDNNHRVWQKVQKNDGKSFLMKSNEFSPLVNFALKRSETKGLLDTPLASEQNNVQKASFSAGLDEMPAESYLMKAASNVDSSDHPTKSTSAGLVDATNKKFGLVSKQTNHSPRKGSNTFRTSMVGHSVIRIQQKEGLESPRQVNQNKLMNIGLVSPGNTEIQRLFVTPPDELECHPSKQLQKNQILMDETKYAEDVGRLVYENDDKDSSLDEDGRISRLPKMGDALHVPQSEVHHDSSFAKMTGDLPDVSSVISNSKSEKCAKSEMGNCHEEYIKKSSSIGPLSQKWVPLGSKHPVVFKDNHGNSLVSSFTDSTLAASGLQGLNQVVEDTDCTLTEADDCTSNFRCPAHVEGEFAGVSAVTDQHVTHEVMDKCVSEFRTDLNMIVKAVDDSYKLQIVSENVQLVYGSPIAEFESFLHFASPVLTPTDYIRSCKVCPQGQLSCDVLCPPQTPCISLGSLWQWYEKPGSYGLEVKVGAYNNLKRCQSHYGFRAYFVPYLSAVQLFGRRSSSLCRTNESLKMMETSGMHESTSPSLGSLPIFSKLCPRPRKVADTFMSESASSCKEEFCNQTAKSTHFSEGELIFEYFESGQPQQRRPLNEKIKELVEGNKSSNCQIFGDPANLEHLNLHELHPASWYSVAWYPIYRIPDGNLRAAFLTYHSLGHFTRRRTSLNTSCGATSLVSPVVGLQSYNTKGECWFQPKQFKQQAAQTEGVDISHPSGILKERLRTLEQTAAVMARASVQKDGRRSANRQPDYELFVSRKW